MINFRNICIYLVLLSQLSTHLVYAQDKAISATKANQNVSALEKAANVAAKSVKEAPTKVKSEIIPSDHESKKLQAMIESNRIKEISTHDIEVIKQELENMGKDDLLVTDVMGVLFTQADKIISVNNKKTYKKFLKEIEARDGKQRSINLDSVVKKNFTSIAVDPQLIGAITEAVEKGTKYLGLTSGRSGQYGYIENLAELRHERLKEVGLTLKEFVKIKKNELLLNDSFIKKEAPYYYKGVIFTNKTDKGKSLEAFFMEADFFPKKIVFIDNQMHKISSLKRLCAKYDIDFVGIHYTKVFNLNTEGYDKKIADMQFKLLDKNEIWVSDEQAACIIAKDDIDACLK